MKKLFLFLQRNQKVLGIFFLFLIMVFVVSPAPAYALPYVDEISKSFTDGNFLTSIVFFFLKLAVRVMGFFVYAGEYLMSIFFEQALYSNVLSDNVTTASGATMPSALQAGWSIVRDICNMFYMFFLLLIAFATILRNQAYGAKALLPKVIISMFLINFSALIAKIIIDVGQVFFFGMITWIGSFATQGSPMTAIVDIFTDRLEGIDPNISGVVFAVFALFYLFALGIMYFLFAGFLLVRLISFVFLVMISPFAFFSLVLPSMRQYESQWWNALIKQSITGPIFIFFIFISMRMVVQLGGLAAAPSANTGLGILGSVISALIPYLITLFMLYAAIPVTQRLGAIGASQTLNFGGTASKVLGAGVGAGLAGYALGKRGSRAAYNRSERAAKTYDKMRDNVYTGIGKLPFAGGKSLELKRGADMEKEERFQSLEKKFGPLDKANFSAARANWKHLTKEQQTFFEMAEATQTGTDLGEDFKSVYAPQMRMKEMYKKLPTSVLRDADAQKRINAGGAFDAGYDAEASARMQRHADQYGLDVNNPEDIKKIRANEEIGVQIRQIVADRDLHKINGAQYKDKEFMKALVGNLTSEELKKHMTIGLDTKEKEMNAQASLKKIVPQIQLNTGTDAQKKARSEFRGKLNGFMVGAGAGVSEVGNEQQVREMFKNAGSQVYDRIKAEDYAVHGYLANEEAANFLVRNKKIDEMKAMRQSIKDNMNKGNLSNDDKIKLEKMLHSINNSLANLIGDTEGSSSKKEDDATRQTKLGDFF